MDAAVHASREVAWLGGMSSRTITPKSRVLERPALFVAVTLQLILAPVLKLDVGQEALADDQSMLLS
jgi:hypothetical protein